MLALDAVRRTGLYRTGLQRCSLVTTSVSLGSEMSRRREGLALSQSEAARQAGVRRGAWVSWEKQGVTPERHRHVLIERVLKWEPGSVEAILEGHEPRPVRHEHSPPGRLPIDEETLKRYEPADRELILAVLRAAEARATRRHSEEGKQQREDPKGA